MKRTSILISGTLGAMMLLLTACGNVVLETPTTGGAQNSAGALNADYENALSVESQLILGTLLLEDTDQAVDAEQAAELLALWQMHKELSSSDTAAAQEKEALIQQIQETMTKDQIKAIADMKLTQSDTFAYMQKAGLVQMPRQIGTPGAGNSEGGNFPGGMEGEPPAGFVVEGGGLPAGGGNMPAGGGGAGFGGGAGPGSDQNLSADQIATMQARRQNRGAFQGTPSVLLEALIELLESKQGLT